MSLSDKIHREFNQAREKALKHIADEAKRVLPDGWMICMAVGWGLHVYDQKRKEVLIYQTARYPKGVKALIDACIAFVETFDYANDRITNKGVSYPAARPVKEVA